MANGEQTYLSVSELLERLNRSMAQHFPAVYFKGEISQLTPAASGHLYLTLKDEEGQVSAAMWRSNLSTVTFRPETGMSVLCRGRPDIFKKSGRFQMIVDRLLPAGEGLLQKRFLELKKKLESEGLFDPARKRQLPFLPRAIGVVTSPTGAVIHDIMVRIKERMPSLVVHLAGVRVQGEGAAQEIAAAIDALSESGLVEVIVVARGGGSLEDLWAFNEEAVVRAIFRSKVPVVSGVGHEVDVTLSDLVADLRAPTPTAAAEMVVPHRGELLRLLGEYERRLNDLDRWFQPLVQRFDDAVSEMQRVMEARIEQCRQHLRTADARLQSIHPARLLAIIASRLELFRERLVNAGQRINIRSRSELERLAAELQRALPIERITRVREQVQHLEGRVARGVDAIVQRNNEVVRALHEKLEAVSPQRVLQRGFAVVRKNGEVLTDAREAAIGAELHITLHRGEVTSKVTGKNEG